MKNTFNNTNFNVTDFNANTVPNIDNIGTGWNTPEQIAYKHFRQVDSQTS